MEVQFSPEIEAELEKRAAHSGRAPAEVVQEMVASILSWEQQDLAEAIEGLRQGHAELQAGKAQPAGEVLEELRRRHGLPG